MTDDNDEPPVRIKAARVDANGVYQGIDTVPEDQLTSLHLPHITSCDLPIGKYRWDFNHKTFVSITDAAPDITPDAQRAIALGFIALLQGGQPCPPETLAWLKTYTDSFDFKGFDPKGS